MRMERISNFQDIGDSPTVLVKLLLLRLLADSKPLNVHRKYELSQAVHNNLITHQRFFPLARPWQGLFGTLPVTPTIDASPSDETLISS